MRQTTRILDILECLAAGGDVSLADLATELDLPRATTHRLLVALTERGYVEHDGGDRVYRLGPAVRALASRSVDSALVRVAAPALSQLRAMTGETVNLAVVSGLRILYAATLDGTKLPKMTANVGQEVEPHASALGKAILAALEPEARPAMLPPAPYPSYTDATITSPEALAAELERSASRKYAVEVEESTAGAACLATVILDPTGRPVGALSVSAVPARLPEAAWPSIAGHLSTWCSRISTQLFGGAESLEGAA